MWQRAAMGPAPTAPLTSSRTYRAAVPEDVSGAVGACPIAAPCHITRPRRRPTHRRAVLVGILRAVGARPRAGLGYRVTDPRDGAADRGAVLEGIGGTVAADPVAGLGHHITE